MFLLPQTYHPSPPGAEPRNLHFSKCPWWFCSSSDVQVFLGSKFPWATDPKGDLSPSQAAWVLPCPLPRTVITTGASLCPTASSALLLKVRVMKVDDLSELSINFGGSGPCPHCTHRKTEVRGWRRGRVQEEALLPTSIRRKTSLQRVIS